MIDIDALVQEAIYGIDCPVSGNRREAIRSALLECERLTRESLLASVEESEDEVVKRLNALPIMSDTAKRGAALLVAQRQEIEILKGHAEAMADTLDRWAWLDGGCKCPPLDAYRAAYPKETP